MYFRNLFFNPLVIYVDTVFWSKLLLCKMNCKLLIMFNAPVTRKNKLVIIQLVHVYVVFDLNKQNETTNNKMYLFNFSKHN